MIHPSLAAAPDPRRPDGGVLFYCPTSLREPTVILHCSQNARRANQHPTGKSAKSCPVPRAKIFRFRRRANHRFNSARLTADEGRVAIVTNVAVRCGGRASCEKTNASRADGEVVWS